MQGAVCSVQYVSLTVFHLHSFTREKEEVNCDCDIRINSIYDVCNNVKYMAASAAALFDLYFSIS